MADVEKREEEKVEAEVEGGEGGWHLYCPMLCLLLHVRRRAVVFFSVHAVCQCTRSPCVRLQGGGSGGRPRDIRRRVFDCRAHFLWCLYK